MLPLICSLLMAVDLPYSQPQVASDGKTAGMVFGSGNSIFFARPDSTPTLVADAPNLALGNHRGPRIVFAGDAIVVTATIAPKERQYMPGTLRVWRSVDQGATWTAGPEISNPGAGGMGFQGIASDGGPRVWAAWIGPEDGHPTLFVSHSGDAGKTWAKQRVLSATVCECCHPTVTVASDGTVRVLFRNNTGGNRDFYLAVSKDGERFEIAKLGQGSWQIDACPMDGGGMAELGGEVVTLWRRQEQLYLARPGGAEESFARGRNASVTLRKEGMYAVWQSGEGIMVKTPRGEPRRVPGGRTERGGGGRVGRCGQDSSGRATIAEDAPAGLPARRAGAPALRLPY
jgi:hypothetical protein